MEEQELKNWPDELMGILANALKLAVEEVEDDEDMESKKKRYYTGDNFDIAVKELNGLFKLDIFAASLTINTDEVDVDHPLLSLTIRPHVWWINELKQLVKEKGATAKKNTIPIVSSQSP